MKWQSFCAHTKNSFLERLAKARIFCTERLAKARLALLACIVTTPLFAGQACTTTVVQPQAVERAAHAAKAVAQALAKQSHQLALIARIGQDLGDQDLLYSHVGFAVKETGGWRITHLLNQCGTDVGGLHREGLVEFFLDDPLSYQSKLVFLKPALEEKVLQALAAHHGKAVFEPRYSVIARPFSKTRQNSTEWLLEVIAAANSHLPDSRDEAKTVLRAQNYQPDVIRISYPKRIAGGLFKANAVFSDHPVSARLSGKYQVSTVRSVFRYLREQLYTESEQTLTPKGEITRAGE
jgi:hypothetical protein